MTFEGFSKYKDQRTNRITRRFWLYEITRDMVSEEDLLTPQKVGDIVNTIEKGDCLKARKCSTRRKWSFRA